MSRPRMNSRGVVGFIICVVVLIVLVTISGTTVASLRAIKRESLYQNKLFEAQALAESGARDALVALSADENWRTGFSQKALGSGYYTVSLSADKRPWITSAGYASSLSLLGRPFKTVKFKAETPPIPQMIYGLLSDTDIDLQGNAYIDSYNSEIDPDPASFGSSAQIWANDDLSLNRSNYSVYGDATYFDSGPGTGKVSGTLTQSTYTISLASTSWSGYESDNENAAGISPSSVYNSSTKRILVPNNVEATLASGVYYLTKLDVNGTLTLNLTQGPVVVFLYGDMTVTGDMVNPTKIPGNFVVYVATAAASTVTIDPSSPYHGVIEGKTASITLRKGTYFGAMAAKDITLRTASKFHQDLSLQRAKVNTVRVVPGSWTSSFKR